MKRAPLSRCYFDYPTLLLTVVFYLSEAFAAINGSAFGRLETKLRFLAALGANSGIKLSGFTGRRFSLVTARLASLGLILESFFRIELLFTCCEYEFLSAVFAS